MKLGKLYGQAMFYDDAIVEFKQAIELNPQMPEVHFSLGATMMMRTGELGYQEAEPELRKELEIDPNQPLAYLALGRIKVVQHREAEAETYLNRCHRTGSTEHRRVRAAGAVVCRSG